ncbi:DUF2510 domain-containing protein [Agromyces silvae]|uniref:DUF2510 domain-containing protein n=1 Tax=Agromyces silvae TaxID=3388266 RepID=UPI00280C0A10|nr:DUF2510 domain-containing protein [Agromyces protaetiae]
MTDPNLPPAGWYDDATGTGTLRYWDGAQWTEHTAPAAPTDTAAAEASAAEASAADASAADAATADAAPTEAAPTDAAPTDAAPTEAAATDSAATEVRSAGAAQPTTADWTSPGDGAAGQPAYATVGAAQEAQAGYAQGHYGQPGYAQAYGAQPGSPQPGAPDPAGKKSVHVLGIIALAVAGLGFVLACIPVTVLFGWILLPIGLVLSIVALFMKGAKWPGIVGISVSVVGMIVAAIVSIVAFVFAVGEIERTIEQYDESSSALEEELDSAFAPEVFGSREDPLAIGETISTDDFDVVINSIDLNATEQVLAADEYNEPPAEGETYAIVNLTVTFKGEGSSTDGMVGVDYVSADGVVKDDAYAYAWGVEPEFGLTELFTGGSTTGNLVLMLPADPDGVLLVSPGFYDEAWVSLR